MMNIMNEQKHEQTTYTSGKRSECDEDSWKHKEQYFGCVLVRECESIENENEDQKIKWAMKWYPSTGWEEKETNVIKN